MNTQLEYILKSTTKEEIRYILDTGRGGEIVSAVMEYAAQLCAEVMRPPADGASLAALLVTGEFDKVLGDHGLAVVPIHPTYQMKCAWKVGWLRSFADRYAAMLEKAVWQDPTDATQMQHARKFLNDNKGN